MGMGVHQRPPMMLSRQRTATVVTTTIFSVTLHHLPIFRSTHMQNAKNKDLTPK